MNSKPLTYFLHYRGQTSPPLTMKAVHARLRALRNDGITMSEVTMCPEGGTEWGPVPAAPVNNGFCTLLFYGGLAGAFYFFEFFSTSVPSEAGFVHNLALAQRQTLGMGACVAAASVGVLGMVLGKRVKS